MGNLMLCIGLVGERSLFSEAYDASWSGEQRSENVGMSNRNSGEKPERRKPKVSLAMLIIQGLGGPKGKPKGVPDGQLVNIPALLIIFL